MRHRQKTDSSFGVLRLSSKEPEVIGPCETKVVEGSINCRVPYAGKWVVVEPPTTSSLPGGVMVANGLASLPPKLPCCKPVILKNESGHDVVISPKSMIAEVNAIQSVLPITSTNPDTPTKPEQKPKISLDFGDSPIPDKWKEQITEKLNSMPDVFAQRDLDFWCTNKIKHHIKLSDETHSNTEQDPYIHKTSKLCVSICKSSWILRSSVGVTLFFTNCSC